MLKLGSRSPVVLTERLALRELRDEDASAIALGAGDPGVARYLLAIPSPYPIALARRWVAMRQRWWRTGRGVTLAITERTDPDQLLGTVSLRRYARDRRAELGYWLATSAWGRGIATEATTTVVDWGFSELRLARIYAQVLADNRASQRVLEKLGMVIEGVKRQHIRKGSTFHDVVLYGLLRDEWPAR
ncbi:MAG: GNAT family N-acetyltransferase [Kofleriaceae bacterium]